MSSAHASHGLWIFYILIYNFSAPFAMLNLQLRLCIEKFKTSFTRVFFVLNSKVSKQEILIGLNSRWKANEKY